MDVLAYSAVALATLAAMVWAWRKHRQKRRWGRLLAIVCAGMALILAVHVVQISGLAYSLRNWYTFLTYEPPPIPEARLSANVDDLPGTIQTHRLGEPLTPGSNVLWTAGLPLAWREAMARLGKDVALAGEPELTAELAASTLTPGDFDPGECFVWGGPVEDATDPDLVAMLHRLGEVPQAGTTSVDWCAFSRLQCQLPFQWEFDGDVTVFDGRQVAAFGCSHDPDRQKAVMQASQVSIVDSRSADDFIIELRTRHAGQHLILAKVPPSATLGATIDVVRQRRRTATPQPFRAGCYLCVPIVDFRLTSETTYRLAGLPGQLRQRVLQDVRFLLDEKGAAVRVATVLESCSAALDVADFIFDRPFLILITTGRAEQPYFALWVGNAELLAPASGG